MKQELAWTDVYTAINNSSQATHTCCVFPMCQVPSWHLDLNQAWSLPSPSLQSSDGKGAEVHNDPTGREQQRGLPPFQRDTEESVHFREGGGLCRMNRSSPSRLEEASRFEPVSSTAKGSQLHLLHKVN